VRQDASQNLDTQISLLKSSQKTQKENPKDEAIYVVPASRPGHSGSGSSSSSKLK